MFTRVSGGRQVISVSVWNNGNKQREVRAVPFGNLNCRKRVLFPIARVAFVYDGWSMLAFPYTFIASRATYQGGCLLWTMMFFVHMDDEI